MPFADGETLSERLEREGQLPILDAIAVAAEIANALEFANALNVYGRVTGATHMPGEGRVSGGTRLVAATGVAAIVVLLVFAGILGLRPTGPDMLVAGATRRFTNAQGLELDPAISPDGNLVAYAARPIAGMELYLKEARGGTANIPLTAEIPGHHRGPRWSPDGSQIAFMNATSGRSAVQIIPASGGEPKTVVETGGGEDEIFGASWSPDGRSITGGMRFYFTVSNLESDVWMMDLGHAGEAEEMPRF